MYDIEKLQSIYLKKFDILSEQVITTYNQAFYDNLFQNYSYYDPLDILLKESFEKIYTQKPYLTGLQDKYKIKIYDYIFYSTITYYKGKNFKDRLDKDIIQSEMKKYPILSKLQIIKELTLNNLENDVALLQFTDDNNNMKLTGKPGYYTFSVMKSIEASVKDSFINNINNKTFLIMMYIDKSEEKRLNLYSQMIDKKLDKFKNEVIDDQTDKNNYILYRFK